MHYVQRMGVGLVLVMATKSAKAQQQPAPQTVLARPGVPAVTLLAEAVKAAKASQKPVLVYYVSGPAFADTFANSAQAGKLLADHYVVLRLVGYEFNRKKSAEPTNPGADSIVRVVGGDNPVLDFLVVDSTGAKIGGVHANSQWRPDPAEFSELLAKTAPRMSEADRKRITDYLVAKYKS